MTNTQNEQKKKDAVIKMHGELKILLELELSSAEAKDLKTIETALYSLANLVIL